MTVLTLATQLSELDWIPPQRVRQLEGFGLRTAGDLLTHFPRRHEDRRQFDRFPQEESETPVCVCGLVAKTTVKRLPGWKKMFEAVLQDEASGLGATLVCRWFNAHYIEKMIATGQRLVVFGKPKLRAKKICIDHPEFEIVENDDDLSIHLKRITPVHPATAGLSARLLRTLIFRLLEKIDPLRLPDRLPAGLDDCGFANALRGIHFPTDWEELKRARRHLVLAEFFGMQLFIAAKRARAAAGPGASHCGPGRLMEQFQAALPFPLTGAQVRAISEIRADLGSAHPMNRLLHGDVGSGKTVVALSAMLLAVEAGFQAALMAPTQILAEQHYLNFKRWLGPLGVRVALRTADRREGTIPIPGSTGVPLSRTSGNCSRYSKRSLPHFEMPWAIYAVTIGTRRRRALSPKARTIVLDSLRHFHRHRYDLIAACVMPDHVHFLLQPRPKNLDESGGVEFWPLSELLHSLKSFSSHEINRVEGTTGVVWDEERFDRYIRSDRDLEEKFHYILRNPWDAGVVTPSQEYPWVWMPEDDFETADEGSKGESSSQRDAATNRRDACSTRNEVAAPCSILSGSPQILIGTHALLYDSVEFSNPGLVVIDEQHKFGVMQRAKLITRGGGAPDVLVMTATPIPRTLTMTVFGDLDVSTLDEMPAGRGRIVTALRDQSKLPDAVKFLREQLAAGRQAYIVYPLIDESEKLDAKAAAMEFEKWRELLAPMPCELLHGRIDPEQKESFMKRFRSGEIKALVATTVIEVGIDVPNATVMLIENAERFGLAQLHQLRGRIGRGAHKSYCILISSADNAGAVDKLRILEKTQNGFEIAEADLRLRGPGDILGTVQSGLPPLKIGDLLEDAELMRLARKAARAIVQRDPALERDENKCFRELADERRKLSFSQVS